MTCWLAAVVSADVRKIKTALGLDSASRVSSPVMTGRVERDVRSYATEMMIHEAEFWQAEQRPGLGVRVDGTVALTCH